MKNSNIARAIVLTALVMVCASGIMQSQPRFQWIKTITGKSFDEGLDMGIGPDGHIHVLGIFSDSVHIDSATLGGIGSYDGFSVRFNGAGRPIAWDAYGGFFSDETRSIAVDNKGNYYIAGNFDDVAVIGGQNIVTIEEFTIDIFVAKFDKMGVLQWVKVFGATDYDESPPHVAVDSVGNVYLAGGFGSTATFGTKSITSDGESDIYVAKISPSGDVVWVKSAGSSSLDMARDVAVSPNGDRVYVAGVFTGSVEFGGLQPIQSFSGKQDLFVWALDANGGYEWLRRIGYGEKDDQISCFADATGKLLVTGAMHGATMFDATTLSANGGVYSDVFLCRFTKSGDIDLLRNYGGGYAETGMAVTSDSRGAIYITGSFDSTATFGGTTVNSNGGSDIFIIRTFPNGDVEWARSAGGIHDDVGRSVVVDASGVTYFSGTFDTEAWFDDQLVKGERFTDAFVAALECGPNTALIPKLDTIEVCYGADTVVRAPGGYIEYTWFVDGQSRQTPIRPVLNMNTLEEGTHSVYVQIVDNYGCLGNSDTITIVVMPGAPEPEISKVGNFLGCSVPDVVYQWYREGRPIAGATSQTIEIQGEGNYRVLITDSRGCTRWSDNFLVGTTHVVDLSDLGISVYPNPFDQQVTLKGALGSEVVVMDLLGRQILAATVNSEITALNVPGAAGSYVLLIKTQHHTASIMLHKR